MSHPRSRLAPLLPAAPERQACFHRRLVKDAGFHRPGRLPSTSAPSARLRSASRGARHRSHDFAVASRLSTPVRPSAQERLDPPPSGGRPSAARRLLQSTQSASTTARSPEPRLRGLERAHFADPAWGTVTADATSVEQRLTRHAPRPAETGPDSTPDQPSPDTLPGGCAPCGATPAEVSRARGRMAFAARRLLSRLRAAGASPRPDPLEHLLSRARDDDGWRGHHRRTPTLSWTPVTSPPLPPTAACAAAVDEGPPPAHLREEIRDPLHPRCFPSLSSPF
jgi:hypothetical protein